MFELRWQHFQLLAQSADHRFGKAIPSWRVFPEVLFAHWAMVIVGPNAVVAHQVVVGARESPGLIRKSETNDALELIDKLFISPLRLFDFILNNLALQ